MQNFGTLGIIFSEVCAAIKQPNSFFPRFVLNYPNLWQYNDMSHLSIEIRKVCMSAKWAKLFMQNSRLWQNMTIAKSSNTMNTIEGKQPGGENKDYCQNPTLVIIDQVLHQRTCN